MNAWNVAIVQRLTVAGLLQVAERAAKKVDLRLGDCLAPGEVTGGHIALWKALAKEGQTPAQIAALVGFPEADVCAELREVPAAPKSGPRLKKVVAAAKPQPDVAEVEPVAVDAADAPRAPAMPSTALPDLVVAGQIAGIQKSLRNLKRLGGRVRQLAYDLHASRVETEKLRAEVAELKASVEGLSPVNVQSAAEREAARHLARFGAAADVVRAAAIARDVQVHEVLSNRPARGRRGAPVLAARKSIIATLTTDPRFRWSQPRIAEVLRKNTSTIYHWQHELDLTPAHLPGLKGESRRRAA